MEQEESYLSYEDFRKNATYDTVKAFFSEDELRKIFPNFNSETHAKKIKEYVDLQYEEIKTKTLGMLDQFTVVTVANSPICMMVNDELHYSIMVVLSKEPVDMNNFVDNDKFQKNILGNKDVICVIPKNINNGTSDDSVLAFYNLGVKSSINSLEKSIFLCEPIRCLTVSDDGNSITKVLYPFTDEFIDYICLQNIGLSHVHKMLQDKETFEDFKEIESKILITGEYKSEEDIRALKEKYRRN